MNELTDLLKRRYSCRNYLSDDIKDEDIQKILYDGTLAPSTNNRQPWTFSVVKNIETKNKICTKHAIPLLKNSENASIVNIASRLGTKPCVEASAYCSAEAGVINFTQASALELSKYKIRVNTVSLSLTITPLALYGWTDKEIEEQKENNPLKRLGKTIDIANAVLFLLSDKANYINGENLNVNGGSLLK